MPSKTAVALFSKCMRPHPAASVVSVAARTGLSWARPQQPSVMDDCVQLILHHACHQRVENHCRKIRAALATGIDDEVSDIQEESILLGSGMIGASEPTLLSYEIQPHEWAPAVKTSELDKANANAKYFELCLQDIVGDYSTERDADNEQLSYPPMRPTRFPCFGWGSRKRLTYTLRRMCAA